jgi:hypothetical protein
MIFSIPDSGKNDFNKEKKRKNCLSGQQEEELIGGAKKLDVYGKI